jgi:AraC-like DNA-binding protein
LNHISHKQPCDSLVDRERATLRRDFGVAQRLDDLAVADLHQVDAAHGVFVALAVVEAPADDRPVAGDDDVLQVADSESGRAGRLAVLAKLSEALFVEALCRYMDDLPPEQTGWLAAARDEVAGNALACLHRDPGRPWTLDELAQAAGTSRTVLAERFTQLLGESPLAYLARWRQQLAARLLETTDRKVLRVALDVGYESEAAFSRAFKRQFGVPPARFRRDKLGEIDRAD